MGMTSGRTVFVSLFGADTILNDRGGVLDVPRTEAAVLALMCGVGRPIHRTELVGALAISTSTLRPVLSRLPKTLGLIGPIHLVEGNRSGVIRLNPDRVRHAGDQIEELLALPQPTLARVETLLRTIEGPVLAHCGLVVDHPLSVEAMVRLEELRERLREAHHTLTAQFEGASDLDVGSLVLSLLPSSTTGEQRQVQPPVIALPEVSLLRERADANAKLGYWGEANEDYRAAIRSALQSGSPTTAAEIGLLWARIAWDPEIGAEVVDLFASFVDDLEQSSLKAQVEVCLMGGTYQSGVAHTDLASPATLERKLDEIGREAGSESFAWSLVRVRRALLGSVSPTDSLAMAQRIVSVGARFPLVHAQGLQAQFSDFIRADQLNGARAALSKLEVISDKPESALQALGQLVTRSCWNLALGRYEVVQSSLARAIDVRPRVGGAMVDQAIVAQSFWLSRERSDLDTMHALRDGALVLAEADHSTPVWAVAAGALEIDLGLHEQGLQTLLSVVDVSAVTQLKAGPHRPGILALAAEILGVVAHAGFAPQHDLAEAVLTQLEHEPSNGILFGWPAIYLGSKERFMGLASLATAKPERARAFLQTAVHKDRHLPPLRARSLEALAMTGDASAGKRAAGIRAALEQRLPTVG